jgi:hypothetical protein
VNNETLTGVTAGAAMVSPWWLPALHTFSAVAAEVLPILGALWLLIQMVTRIVDTVRKWNNVGYKE